MKLAVLLLLAGCTVPTAPDLLRPLNPQPFEPPAVYAVWMEEALACVGSAAGPVTEVARIRWYMTSGWDDRRTRIVIGGMEPEVMGEYEPAPPSIYLRRDVLGERRYAQHEMGHHVLGGDARHADPRWACLDPEAVR